MKRAIAAVLAFALSGAAAMADAKVSDEDVAKLKGVLEAWGCTGGEFEQETEGTGVFEAEEVKCKDGGQYDFKIGKDFKVISITAD